MANSIGIIPPPCGRTAVNGPLRAILFRPATHRALRVQLTPDERDELEKAAEGQGAPNLSTYAHELLFRRSAAVVAATKRNPEDKALGGSRRAIGNNLNPHSPD